MSAERERGERGKAEEGREKKGKEGTPMRNFKFSLEQPIKNNGSLPPSL